MSLRGRGDATTSSHTPASARVPPAPTKRERAEADPTPLAEFTGRPSEVALYHRGPRVLAAFEEAVGPEAFQTLIRASIRDDVRTNEALFELIDRELGPEARTTLQELMATV